MSILQTAKEYLATHSENPENGNYEAYTIISQLVDELEQFQWVSVDETLPTERGWVFALGCDKDVAFYSAAGECFYYDGEPVHPTHWMPIPKGADQ